MDSKNPLVLSEQEDFYWQLQEKVKTRVKGFNIEAVRAVFGVLFTYLTIEARISKRLQGEGLTIPGFNCLILMAFGNTKGYSLTELSKFLVSSRANMTGVIDSLARRGYVTREDHPKDRRVIIAKITPAGLSWLQGYFPLHARMMAGFGSALNHKEQKQLLTLLAKMRARAMSMTPEPGVKS
jgi:DNA-binding MarR family transcriptional regulator